jgi:hypothetical protein
VFRDCERRRSDSPVCSFASPREEFGVPYTLKVEPERLIKRQSKLICRFVILAIDLDVGAEL